MLTDKYLSIRKAIMALGTMAVFGWHCCHRESRRGLPQSLPSGGAVHDHKLRTTLQRHETLCRKEPLRAHQSLRRDESVCGSEPLCGPESLCRASVLISRQRFNLRSACPGPSVERVRGTRRNLAGERKIARHFAKRHSLLTWVLAIATPSTHERNI